MISSTSIFPAAGTLGRPGIVIISPASATVKSVLALTCNFFAFTVNPRDVPALHNAQFTSFVFVHISKREF